jgi:hypothetical protein
MPALRADLLYISIKLHPPLHSISHAGITLASSDSWLCRLQQSRSPEQAAKLKAAQERAAKIHSVIMLSISDIDIDHFFKE